MNPGELVVDKEAFSVLSGECEKIINTRKLLPDFVFRRSFAKYFAIEHAHIFKKEFGSFLFKISSILQDESVNYMTLDPDPVDYYYRHFSFFGLASIKRSSLVERYLSAMSRDGNVDSFLARGGDVGAFWGSSLKWGIFCDRISWEIAVIAVPENVDVPTISGFRCMDPSWLSDYVKSQYRIKDPSNSIALDFTRRFLASYSI
ncbi:MAG: hypothetical protein ACHQIK_00780 [Candidatus Acidiferrales bacterium]